MSKTETTDLTEFLKGSKAYIVAKMNEDMSADARIHIDKDMSRKEKAVRLGALLGLLLNGYVDITGVSVERITDTLKKTNHSFVSEKKGGNQ